MCSLEQQKIQLFYEMSQKMVHEKNINSGVCNALSRVIKIISQLKLYEMNIEIKNEIKKSL